MINIPKGTKDVLPAEAYKWHFVENTARRIAALYGFESDNALIKFFTYHKRQTPGEYRNAIDRKYEVIDLGSRSWFVNAVSAATLFNSKKIQTKFEEKRAAKTEGTEKVPAAEEK